MMATSEPGIFFDSFGVKAMIATLRTPTAVVIQSVVLKCWK